MTQIPAVSVMVPVYNVEPYIERCAHSLFGQTLGNVEYIFVNDCTQDNSMKILSKVLDHYPNRKPRVKIIDHKTNKGLASARNTALDAASGKYLIHMDSDDWIELDMLEKLYRKACEGDYDIVWCDFYEDTLSESRRIFQSFPQHSESCIKRMMSGGMHGSNCNKMVCRSLYNDNGLRYFDGLDMWEDLAMTIRLFACADKVAYLSEACYHYIRYNPHSIMSDPDPQKVRKKMIEIITNTDHVVTFLSGRGDLGKYKREINYMKLHAKCGLATRDPVAWRNTYPEANRFVLSCPRLNWNYKITQWLCARGCFFIPRLRNRLIKWIKQ